MAGEEMRLKLLDIAKSVADTYAPKSGGADNIATRKGNAKDWHIVFDQVYKSLLNTLERKAIEE